MRKIETKAKIRKKVQAVNPYPQVHETFFIPVRVSSDIQKRPSCFNGMVRVRRYRITIEEIDEPVEVISAERPKRTIYADNDWGWGDWQGEV